jgi:hypothetical protein
MAMFGAMFVFPAITGCGITAKIGNLAIKYGPGK